MEIKDIKKTIENKATLLAVSKTQTYERVENMFKQGVENFGENYLIEAEEKIKICTSKNINPIWHFIGKIQSKKCNKIAKIFDWVQTVDREKVAILLNKYAEENKKILQICIQINISNDENKSGIKPDFDTVKVFFNKLEKFSHLKIRGIMIMPSMEDKNAFFRSNELFTKLKGCFDIDTLSMGMSNDFLEAIKNGSTMVRIGTAIFGQRIK